MKDAISVNLDYAGIKQQEMMTYSEKIEKIEKELIYNANEHKDYVGWLNWPDNYDEKEFEKIKKIAAKIKKDSDVLIVIGIGGSYLGARAIIEALNRESSVEVLYVGNNLSANYINRIIDYVSDKDISINVISKSGKTTEPAIAFRIFRSLLENKYGIDKAKGRIFVTTTKRKGALYKIALQEKYARISIPEDIGGRYSVLTAVGLLPMAVAGVNIDKIMQGAKAAMKEYSKKDIKSNDCYKYAIARNVLFEKEKNIEILGVYEPDLYYLTEWWKQLYGESEGKNYTGIFPAAVTYTTDLHSLGQYVQEGRRNLFETIINVKKSESDIIINYDDENLDELNYVAGKSVSYVCQKALEATVQAHVDGGVPNIIIEMSELNEITIGKLIYFFEKACAISGKILGINPFDQPGVEKYKENMFKLLGKYNQK